MNKKKLLFAALYFAEGAPIGFIWWALPSILSERGFALDEVSTLMALAVLPWTLKFCFGPFVDNLQLRGLSVRKQLFFFQVLMGATALSFSYFIDLGNMQALTWVVLLHASFAAAQDVCIDTLAIRSIPPGELGSVNGYMQAGVLLGRSLFGGVSLFLVTHLGLDVLVYLLVGSIWVSLVALLSSRKMDGQRPDDENLTLAEYFLRFKELVLSLRSLKFLLLTFLAGLSFKGISGVDAAALVHIKVPAETRAWIFAALVPALMLVGALVGGRLADFWKSQKALGLFIVWSAGLSMAYSWCFDTAQTGILLLVFLSLFYLGVGLITASLYAYLMKQTDPLFAAFEFGLFMAVVNLSESFATWFSGQFSEGWTYMGATAPQVVVALAALGLLKSLPDKFEDSVKSSSLA